MANARTGADQPLLSTASNSEVSTPMTPVNTTAELNLSEKTKSDAVAPVSRSRNTLFSCSLPSKGEIVLGTLIAADVLIPLIGMVASGCFKDCNSSFGKVSSDWMIANLFLSFIALSGFLLHTDCGRHHPGPAPRSP